MKGYVYANKKLNLYQEIRGINFVKDDNTKTYYIELLNSQDVPIDAVPMPRVAYFYLKQHVTLLNQALEYLIRKCMDKVEFTIEKYEKDTMQFYNGNLELSRRHILADITIPIDIDEYYLLANDELDTFNEENNIEVWLEGRSDRHCVIKDTDENRLRYEDLRVKFNKMQDEFIDYINGMSYVG